MKKNGFTLIEMIASVVLIALLGTVILVNMTGIKSDEDQKSASKFQLSVEEAACTYIDMSANAAYREECKKNTSGCKIKLSVLIGQGALFASGENSNDPDLRNSKTIALIDPEYKDPDTNVKAEDEKNSVCAIVKWNIKTDNDIQTLKKECTFKRGSDCS